MRRSDGEDRRKGRYVFITRAPTRIRGDIRGSAGKACQREFHFVNTIRGGGVVHAHAYNIYPRKTLFSSCAPSPPCAVRAHTRTRRDAHEDEEKPNKRSIFSAPATAGGGGGYRQIPFTAFQCNSVGFRPPVAVLSYIYRKLHRYTPVVLRFFFLRDK